jgi:hypothetical protein
MSVLNDDILIIAIYILVSGEEPIQNKFNF